MSEPAQKHDPRAAWGSAVRAAQLLMSSVASMRGTDQQLVVLVRSALHDATEHDAALVILSRLNDVVVLGLVDDLVETALSHRDAGIARQLLGRLPYLDTVEAVPPAVWRLLAETGDYDAYRRMAELLQHLGLDDELAELCRRAADSDDKDIREVAADFG